MTPTIATPGFEGPKRDARRLDDPLVRYAGYKPGVTELTAGTVVKDGHAPLMCDITFQRDVSLTLRDGTVVYVDVFRPTGAASVPAILPWGPFGKQIGCYALDDFPMRMGIPATTTSGLEAWEAPDPSYWCNHGYAIVSPDPRGAYRSDGDIMVYNRQEGRDGHDVIEWIASQPWCNGKVGMAGNSWLATAQWFIASECPAHLAAIAPWEGEADLYRDLMMTGGIPDPAFMDALLHAFVGPGQIDDIAAATESHPLFDEYWEQHRAEVEKINVPVYAGASWSNAIHTPGSIRAYRRLAGTPTWLRVHNTMEWPDFHAYEEDLRAFFDHYLHGLDNGWEDTPAVRVSVLDPGGEDDVDRPMATFPPPDSERRRLYLDASTGGLDFDPSTDSASARYASDDSAGRVEFTHRFTEDTELIGFPSVHLRMEAVEADDADVFVVLQKLDEDGALLVSRTVPFTDPDVLEQTRKAFEAGVPEVRILFHEGPWGSVRASHRALEPESSTAEDPVFRHLAPERITPGEILEVDIPMTPMATKWHAGQRLRLVIAGYKLSASTPPGTRYVSGEMTPPRTINRGEHVIHTGPDNESYVTVPVNRPSSKGKHA